jgi:aspartyl-tRNA(Asn)/glutamyl-tRNA(Gln) amidotransferase subunit A
MQLHQMTARALRTALGAGECSAAEILASFLARIEEDAKRSDSLNAFIETWPEEARARAEAQDRMLASGAPGKDAPLLGIPLAIKDNLHLKGHALSCASRFLEGYRAVYTAHALARLAGAGANFIGRTNMDELAIGSTGETSCFGPVRNPHNRALSPGGSSSGSAAAVAAGLVPAALGSDTGGSVRQPASFCGVVGLKPSYGRVSRHGLAAGATSMDQIGILCRTAEDAALILTGLAGHDAQDGTSCAREVPDYTQGLDGDLKGMRIGLPKEYFAHALEADVAAGVEAACARLRELGAEFIDISLPHFEYAAAAYSVLFNAEASSNLGCIDGIRFGRRAEAKDLAGLYSKSRGEGFGSEVKRRILLGTHLLSSGCYTLYYEKAQKARRLIAQDFVQAFGRADLILTPTSPTAAFSLGGRADSPEDPASSHNADVFTQSVNLAGLPAISLPCARTSAGLPVGLQLMAAHFEEQILLRAAHRIEKALGFAGGAAG